MKKIFISYKFTGVSQQELHRTIGEIVKTLRLVGYEVYFSLEDENYFNENSMTTQQIMDHCNQKLANSDLVIVILRHWKKSSGMLQEVKKANDSGIPVLLYRQFGIRYRYLSIDQTKTFFFLKCLIRSLRKGI